MLRGLSQFGTPGSSSLDNCTSITVRPAFTSKLRWNMGDSTARTALSRVRSIRTRSPL